MVTVGALSKALFFQKELRRFSFYGSDSGVFMVIINALGCYAG